MFPRLSCLTRTFVPERVALSTFVFSVMAVNDAASEQHSFVYFICNSVLFIHVLVSKDVRGILVGAINVVVLPCFVSLKRNGK